MPTFVEDWRAIAQEWLADEELVITTAIYAVSVLVEYPGIVLYRAVFVKEGSPLLLGMKGGEPHLVFPVNP